MDQSDSTWRGALAAALLLASGCSFPSRTDTLADDLLRYAGSYEALRSDARSEVVYVDTLPAGPDETFRRMVQAHLEVGLPPGRTDHEGRVVAGHVPRLGVIAGRPPAYWLDCSGGTTGPAVDAPHEVALWFASRVIPLEGGSVVQSILRADLLPSARNADPVPCLSRGALESHLAELARRDPG